MDREDETPTIFRFCEVQNKWEESHLILDLIPFESLLVYDNSTDVGLNIAVLDGTPI
jgi:hypothetical protein